MNAMPEFHIRPYRDHDSAELIGLIRELQAHEFQLFDRMKPPGEIGKWYVDDLQRLCRADAGQILVLECNGHIAGYAVVLTAVEQNDADEVAYTYAMVKDIAVTHKQRGKGFGKRLLQECERCALDAGANWLRITVMSTNTRALHLYRQHGFDDHLIELEKPL